MEGPRIFIAVPLDPVVKREIQKRSRTWREALPFRKWVAEEDYHITLKFIGQTDLSMAKNIQSIMDRIASNHRRFQLSVSGLGTFGKPQSPSILWNGIQGELDRLYPLQTDIEDAMDELGFDKEKRPFRPHLTVARRYEGRSPFDISMLHSINSTRQPPLDWTVNEITLYESVLDRKPPMYDLLHSARFADN